MSDEATHKPTETAAEGEGFDFADPNSPLAPYYLYPSQVVAVLILCILFLLLNFAHLWHTDIWGHLKFGQWIVENRSLPRHEPFSVYADPDAPYIHFQWLTQVFFYLAYSAGEALAGGDQLRQTAGGVEMLRTVHAVLTVLRYFCLLIAFRRVTGSIPLACTGLLLVFLSSAVWIQRPQVVGELLFAALLIPLSRPELSRRALFLIPALFVLWANCHGSFLIGLFFLGVLLLGRAVEVGWGAGSRFLGAIFADAQVRKLVLVLVASAGLVAVANPHGPALYSHVLRLAKHPNIPTLEEWQPLNFSTLAEGGRTYLGLLLLLVVSQLFSRRTLSPTQLLLVLSFGIFPLLQRRMLIWWSMTAPWVVLPLWPGIVATWRQPAGDSGQGEEAGENSGAQSPPPDTTEETAAASGELKAPPQGQATGEQLAGQACDPAAVALSGGPEEPQDEAEEQPAGPDFRKTLLAVAILFLTLIWSNPVRWALSGNPAPLQASLAPATPWLLAEELRNPGSVESLSKLTKILKDYYPEGKYTGSVYASEMLGEYLLWALPKETPVFVYTHAHLFPERHWREHMTVLAGEPRMWEVLDRNQVNLVAVEAYRTALIDALRREESWTVIQDPDPAAVFGPGKTSAVFIAVRTEPLAK